LLIDLHTTKKPRDHVNKLVDLKFGYVQSTETNFFA